MPPTAQRPSLVPLTTFPTNSPAGTAGRARSRDIATIASRQHRDAIEFGSYRAPGVHTSNGRDSANAMAQALACTFYWCMPGVLAVDRATITARMPTVEFARVWDVAILLRS